MSLSERIPKPIRIGLLAAGGVGFMVLLMVWLAGGFRDKIAPQERGPLPPAPKGLPRLKVEALKVPVVRELAGSIAAEHETNVASQLLGRVTRVHGAAGQQVTAGQVLVEVAEAEHRARLQQAEALLRQATDRYERIEKQHRAEAATEAQLVEARTARQAAQAKVREAKTVLAKTKIRSPVDGVLIERLCEVGDTVTPGRPVARVYDRLQLVATVPEALQPKLKVGETVAVRVDALAGECQGRITEIVPQADAVSRAFRVKVQGECKPGLIPGMFGRLRLVLGEREELRIPTAAVRRVGQITLVFRCLADGGLLRQFVTLGERHGEHVAVLSGLSAGDEIVADASAVPRDAP